MISLLIIYSFRVDINHYAKKLYRQGLTIVMIYPSFHSGNSQILIILLVSGLIPFQNQ
jgi:hypothetical protein